MATCKKIKRLSEKVCIGSLNQQIDLQVRTLAAPTGDSVDFDLGFTVLKNVWSMVETVAGKVFFDDSNTDRSITHNFYIRYINGVEITAENWISYKGKYFDIVNVENLDEADRFLLLRATERGSTTKPVNKA
jgi:SPP1 family predicted phage head-tail adaptor